MAIHKYIETVISLSQFFDACDIYKTFSLCIYLLPQHKCVNSYLVFFSTVVLNVWIYSINMMVTVLKNYLLFVPQQEKKSATIPKHIKDFL